jgi:hypothetical protein
MATEKKYQQKHLPSLGEALWQLQLQASGTPLQPSASDMLYFFVKELIVRMLLQYNISDI